MAEKSWIGGILEKPKCASCGDTGFFKTMFECNGENIVHNRIIDCEKKVCINCVYQWREKEIEGGGEENYYYCRKHMKSLLMKLDDAQLDELKYHYSVLIPEKKVEGFIYGKDLEDFIDSIIQLKYEQRKIKKEKKTEKMMGMIDNLIIAEKLEEALEYVEELEMWEKAGEIRKKIRRRDRKDREIVTKHIHLNANDLFKQIRHEGLVIPYKCPNCNGTLKITGNKKIEVCPFCGSDLDLETLNNFVNMLME